MLCDRMSLTPFQTISSLGVLRNRIGTAAVHAVHRHLGDVFRQKRLETVNARAKFVSGKFKSDDDHPFIWNQYVVGDIPNHPETGGYQTVSAWLLCFTLFSDILIDSPRCLPE
jgi:hypothetical protein